MCVKPLLCLAGRRIKALAIVHGMFHVSAASVIQLCKSSPLLGDMPGWMGADCLGTAGSVRMS